PCLWKLCRFGVRGLGRERARERTQQRRPVALPGAAVHYREDERMLAGELLERGGGLRGVGVVVHLLPERLARAEDLALGEGAVDRLAHGEEVAAEERAGLELHHEAVLPRVRHVRRVEPLEGVAAGAQDLAVGERAGR